MSVKNIVITGASRGMGRSMAVQFAGEGHRLILCARSRSGLESTRAAIQADVPACPVELFAADVTRKEEVIAFADFCLGFGAPDILINNAGTFTPGNCIDEPEGQVEHLMQLNLYSAYHLTRRLVPAMMEKKSGHIFNLCSIASLKAYPGGGGYGISKFAMYGFSQNLRLELMPHGIKVTSVFPGAVLTDSWGDFDNSSGRIMEASDIARMVHACTLLSPQAVVEDIIIRPQLGDL